jgi:hypothetical protein
VVKDRLKNIMSRLGKKTIRATSAILILNIVYRFHNE